MKEMKTFVYNQKNDQAYTFGHMKGYHDDTIYSTCWAIYALRNQIVNLFELGNIECTSRSRNRRHCFIMGGDLSLFCGDRCEAYHQVEEMFRQYKRIQMDSELNISEFFMTYVKVRGALVYQAA